MVSSRYVTLAPLCHHSLSLLASRRQPSGDRNLDVGRNRRNRRKDKCWLGYCVYWWWIKCFRRKSSKSQALRENVHYSLEKAAKILPRLRADRGKWDCLCPWRSPGPKSSASSDPSCLSSLCMNSPFFLPQRDCETALESSLKAIWSINKNQSFFCLWLSDICQNTAKSLPSLFLSRECFTWHHFPSASITRRSESLCWTISFIGVIYNLHPQGRGNRNLIWATFKCLLESWSFV